MTNDIYGSDSAVPSGLGLLFHHPTLERVGYSRASLRESGFGSVVRFDQCMAEKCPNSRRGFSPRRRFKRRDAVRTRPPRRLRYDAKISDLRQSRRLEMMNGSKPCGPSGGFQAPSPKRRRPRLRVSCSPSPQPSPQGEGETFARALVIRPRLVVCPPKRKTRSEDRTQRPNFQRGSSPSPWGLGERAGVHCC